MFLHARSFPESWATGTIIPIFKSGEKNQPNNYRGITLLPILAKLFTSIIAERLKDWAHLSGLLGDCQFGFREGFSTVDAIFVLQTLLEKSQTLKQPLYSAASSTFGTEAFDSISHTLLWRKLRIMGMSELMLSLLSDMYGKAKALVRVNDVCSNKPVQVQCGSEARMSFKSNFILFVHFGSSSTY